MKLRTIARTSWVLAALLAAGRSSAGQGGASSDRAVAKPAAVPMPALPGPDRGPQGYAPQDGQLPRNGVVADRFVESGQTARYAFDCAAGELSLFEGLVAGYSRGWQAAVTLRVLDGTGRELASRTFEGGTQFRPFLAFVAPAAGSYALEVAAARQFVRYVLVRHSDYGAHAAEAVEPVDERARVHGWLADGADRVSYRIPVRAGEELALALEGTREEARREARIQRADADGAEMPGMAMERRLMAQREGQAAQFPRLRLALDGVPVTAASATFARLTPEADGEIVVSATGYPGEAGGLFDLVVRRDVPKVRVFGVVADHDDEPLAGVRLTLWLEPDREPWGEVRSDAEGHFEARVPPGNYRVGLAREGAPHPQVSQVGVEGESEVNLIWEGAP